MAKRKSHKKKGGRRRHRKVGALALNPSSPLVQLGSVAVGYLAADTINTQIDKFTGTMDEKVKGGAQVGIGALLVLSKKTKTHMLAVVPGGVLAGSGLKRLLKSFGVITGYQSVPTVGKRMNGYGQVKVIGTMPQQSLNGAGTTGGFMVPKPIGSSVMGNASGSGLRHNSSDFMD